MLDGVKCPGKNTRDSDGKREWGGQGVAAGSLRCCWEKVGEVHLQVEGWGSQAILWGSHPFPIPAPNTVFIVEGTGALQMGKMRWRVSLFGDPRMEFEPGLPGPYTKKHRKRIVLKMEKARGLQIIQIHYCKAHKLLQINGEEGRTSSWWPLSLTSPSPTPSLRSVLSILCCPLQFSWPCFSLSWLHPPFPDLPSLLPTATISAPFSPVLEQVIRFFFSLWSEAHRHAHLSSGTH